MVRGGDDKDFKHSTPMYVAEMGRGGPGVGGHTHILA